MMWCFTGRVTAKKKYIGIRMMSLTPEWVDMQQYLFILMKMEYLIYFIYLIIFNENGVP